MKDCKHITLTHFNGNSFLDMCNPTIKLHAQYYKMGNRENTKIAKNRSTWEMVYTIHNLELRYTLKKEKEKIQVLYM